MKYQTTHEFAQQLLAGPNVPVVIAVPAFDAPGVFTAMPVRTEARHDEEKGAYLILLGSLAEEKAPEPKNSVDDTKHPA